MKSQSEVLLDALKGLPAPDPSPEFVDRAIATAIKQSQPQPNIVRTFTRSVRHWEIWLGAALGGAVAVACMIVLRWMQPHESDAPRLALALHEVRPIDVMIDSERPLVDATIRVFVTGSVELDGLTDNHQVEWHADLDPGHNVLSLPVAARRLGSGRLIAVVEHEGKQRTIEINLTVRRSAMSHI